MSSQLIAALSQEVLDGWQAVRLGEGEDYHAHRAALRADPALQPLVAEGDRRFAGKPAGVAAPIDFHRAALLAVGFQAGDEVWRHHADAILVALR